jgi:hypothetical protein
MFPRVACVGLQAEREINAKTKKKDFLIGIYIHQNFGKGQPAESKHIASLPMKVVTLSYVH